MQHRPDIARIYPAVGERVRAARERVGLKTEELADRVGISRTSIVQLEAGYQRLPLETLYLIASELGIDITAVLPSLSELAPIQQDILTKVSNDTALDPQERKVLLEFFKQYLPDTT